MNGSENKVAVKMLSLRAGSKHQTQPIWKCSDGPQIVIHNPNKLLTQFPEFTSGTHLPASKVECFPDPRTGLSRDVCTGISHVRQRGQFAAAKKKSLLLKLAQLPAALRQVEEALSQDAHWSEITDYGGLPALTRLVSNSLC